ncbi:TetR/AcrR family transcriptional regulator [Ruania suaedae]|uniref:TetR/AcrR family transcriptional regulator n=1 Tax=Ruania suaedae TaxID=2897774 RepID=UPI001E376DBB|nr:TetR/AcrR family transcriptional regulator [Ruania suaedae]UFU01791.1 TetR/AcrR family transcriptional regulator [Ruania suaedae]
MAAQQASYHHGNLRADLVEAGLALVRAGGPEALSLREATRSVGVTPSAAYRHFSGRPDLLAAVSSAVHERMATAMLRHWPAQDGRAWERLYAVGIGYIEFARAEPGWFAAFFTPDGVRSPDRVPPPFALLTEALDGMVGAGLLSEHARYGAEWPCWSAVHGFALLASSGPLRHTSAVELRHLADQTVRTAIAGICAESPVR